MEEQVDRLVKKAWRKFCISSGASVIEAAALSQESICERIYENTRENIRILEKLISKYALIRKIPITASRPEAFDRHCGDSRFRSVTISNLTCEHYILSPVLPHFPFLHYHSSIAEWLNRRQDDPRHPNYNRPKHHRQA